MKDTFYQLLEILYNMLDLSYRDGINSKREMRIKIEQCITMIKKVAPNPIEEDFYDVGGFNE